MKKITVVIVGMGFGKEFIPIYQKHPNIKSVGVCTRNPETLRELKEKFNLDDDLLFTDLMRSLKEMMSMPSMW
nr:Gfo/Idh/MocA family oxidoreductase [Sphingobacterium sp. IITKGP-BTPF85]